MKTTINYKNNFKELAGISLKKGFIIFLKQMSKKKYILICFILYGIYMYSNNNSGSSSLNLQNQLTPLEEANLKFFEIILPISGWFPRFLNWIGNIQTDAINVIAHMEMSASGTFSFLYPILKIFAMIGCIVKMAIHFASTERHDSVKAITGYFPYIGMLVLSWFSKPLVLGLTSYTQSVNTVKLEQISTTLKKGVVNDMVNDYKLEFGEDGNALVNDGSTAITRGLQDVWISIQKSTFAIKYSPKYSYYNFMGALLMSLLTIPGLILTFMTKIMLSLLIAATTLVFLISFIPGFEDSWKQLLTNILNVMLWIPIFNFIVTIIIDIMSKLIQDDSMGTGAIVIITILGLAMAYQSLSLTFAASNAIISGAGGSAGAALSGLTSMNSVSIISKIAATAATVAVLGATGGVSLGATTSKDEKD